MPAKSGYSRNLFLTGDSETERTEKKLDTWAVKLAGINLSYPVDLVCGILFLLIGIVLLLAMPQQRRHDGGQTANGKPQRHQRHSGALQNQE